MRLAITLQGINVYWHHAQFTPNNVRVVTYGEADHWALIPEEGDLVEGFPGYMGDLITVRVIDVVTLGNGRDAYQVTVETVTE